MSCLNQPGSDQKFVNSPGTTCDRGVMRSSLAHSDAGLDAALVSATEPLLEWNSGHSFALAVPPPVQLETHPVLAVCAVHHQLQELRMMELPVACF